MSTAQQGQIAKPAPTPLTRIEGQYRAALAERWLAVVWRSALYSTLISALVLWCRGGFSVKALIAGLLAGAAAYPFAVYPILSARRSILVSPTPGPLRSSLTSLVSTSLFSAQGIRYLSVHATSGAVFCALYAVVLSVCKPQAELGLFATTPRHPLHLNERFIFLLLGNVGMMSALASWDLLARRIKATWPNRLTNLPSAAFIALTDAIPIPGQMKSIGIPTIWAVVYSLVYFVLRKQVWLFLLTHSFGVLRPFVINFVKPSRALGFSIIPQLLALELMTVFAARMPPIDVLTPFLTSPLDFARLRRKSPLSPEQHLVTVLKTKDLYLLHFTLMELLQVSNQPARRQALFTTTSKSQPPILEIWQDLLLHLGRAHQTLITRGGARKPTAAPAARPAPVKDNHTVQVRQANIFRPALPQKPSGITSAFQSALEGPVQAAPPAILGKAQQLALEAREKAETKAVEWTGEVLGKVEQHQVGGTVLKEARGFWANLGDWTGEEWAERYVGGSLPEVVMIERIMDIFALLACASLKEDTYGYVQGVLPATLEIIVRHRSALLSLESELMMNAGALSRGDERAKRDIRARIAVPVQACERSVRRIADAFGESLSAFRFPTAVGSALSEICRTRPEDQSS